MVDSPAKLKKITDAIDVAKHEANTADSCTNVKKKWRRRRYDFEARTSASMTKTPQNRR